MFLLAPEPETIPEDTVPDWVWTGWIILGAVFAVIAIISLFISYYGFDSLCWKKRFRVARIREEDVGKGTRFGEQPTQNGYAEIDHVGVALEGIFFVIATTMMLVFAFGLFSEAAGQMVVTSFGIITAIILGLATVAVYMTCKSSPDSIQQEIRDERKAEKLRIEQEQISAGIYNQNDEQDPSSEELTSSEVDIASDSEIKKVRTIYRVYFWYCLVTAYALVLSILLLGKSVLNDSAKLSKTGTKVTSKITELNDQFQLFVVDQNADTPKKDPPPPEKFIENANGLLSVYDSYRDTMLQTSERYLAATSFMVLLVLWALGTRYRFIYTGVVQDICRMIAIGVVFVVIPMIALGGFFFVINYGVKIRNANHEFRDLINDRKVKDIDIKDFHEFSVQAKQSASVYDYYLDMVSSWGSMAVILSAVLSWFRLRALDDTLFNVLRPRHIQPLIGLMAWAHAIRYVPDDEAEAGVPRDLDDDD